MQRNPAAPSGSAQLTADGSITLHSDGMTVRAYRGDGSVMLVMNLPQARCTDLAGFAIARSVDGGASWTFEPNRLSFKAANAVTADTDPNRQLAQREGSDAAPFQKFHWVDYPPETSPITQYRVVARYFVAGKDPAVDADALRDGPSVTFALDATTPSHPRFRVCFTRGYISSQAFDERYAGVKILRAPGDLLFDEKSDVPGAVRPTTWLAMYEWLGANAHALLVDFVVMCDVRKADIDVFAYDLDEPDFIQFMIDEAKNGRTVRLLLDDAPLHTKATAREVVAAKLLAAGGVDVKRGHFKRFAHDKCIVAKLDGKAFSVLTGSANFSVRGLYVQSNSVVVIDDPGTAQLYQAAFDQALNDMAGFEKSPIASKWFDGPTDHDVPAFAVSFAPHADPSVSLDRFADAIANAKSSVMFAVMELSGGGAVLEALRDIQKNDAIFSYGVTQTIGGLKYYKSSAADGLLVPFSFLDKNVPAPFDAEWRGGPGQIIHHKFVVIDFNEENPIVFCGSSNLAAGGEADNGDNLLAIMDPAIATLYAIEAIKLVDHYEFRYMQSQATARNALQLAGPKASPQWWASSFEAGDVHARERAVFSG